MDTHVVKKRGRDKTHLERAASEVVLAKPAWLRGKSPDGEEVRRLTRVLREHNLHTVCEEANCPNMGECFRCGTATFIVMGDVCTRCCPFCDVAHGRPASLDGNEPDNLGQVVQAMGLKYVVVTSVNRDDLPDKGAGHFVACIQAIRRRSPDIKVEILVPDFRDREALALDILAEGLPDVFNHNLETVPRLYGLARPGADYQGSLNLLRQFKARHPGVPTKSGLMVGLGEEDDEILAVMKDLRAHGCDMLTIGQYLRPSRDHLPVKRYVTPEQFEEYRRQGLSLGFVQVAAAPLVRSSYHAELQAKDVVA
jgi:lipoic acid synthetase